MKKRFTAVVAAILLALASAGLAGCGEDEKPAAEIISVGEGFYAENVALPYTSIYTPAGSRFTVKVAFENTGEERCAKASFAVYRGENVIGAFEADLGTVAAGNTVLTVKFAADKETAERAERVVLVGIVEYAP